MPSAHSQYILPTSNQTREVIYIYTLMPRFRTNHKKEETPHFLLICGFVAPGLLLSHMQQGASHYISRYIYPSSYYHYRFCQPRLQCQLLTGQLQGSQPIYPVSNARFQQFYQCCQFCSQGLFSNTSFFARFKCVELRIFIRSPASAKSQYYVFSIASFQCYQLAFKDYTPSLPVLHCFLASL